MTQKLPFNPALLLIAFASVACSLVGAAAPATQTPLPVTTLTSVAVQPTSQPPATTIPNTSIPVSVPTAVNCNNAPTPQLAVGMVARVSPGTANNLRSQPSKSSTLVTTLSEGQQLNVLGGPVCADGYQWWQVKTDQNQGWTAEGIGDNYWLVPAISAPVKISAGAPTQAVSYANVSFAFSAKLSDHVLARTVYAAPRDPNLPAFLNTSQRLEFTLNIFDYTTGTRPMLLTVYKISDLEGNDSDYTPMVNDLHNMLAQQPAVTVGSGLTSPITVIPIQNAAQELHTQNRYFRFGNGIGIRFITYYSQGPGPIDNNYLTYVYQGISDNSQYFVSALIPITTPNISQLPPYTNPTDNTSMNSYLNQVAQKMDTFKATDFSATLDDLDAWLASIQVS